MTQQTSGSYKIPFPSPDAAEPRTIAIYGGILVLTWLLLGKIGLVLAGVAVGASLRFWWDEFTGSAQGLGHGRNTRELGIEVVQRLTSWQSSQTSTTKSIEGESWEEEEEPPQSKELVDYSDYRPLTAAALTTISDTIIEQYVEWWYQPILPSSTGFPLESRNTLIRFIRSMGLRLSRKRPAEILVHFLTNSSSVLIVFLGELSAALGAETEVPSSSVEELVYTYLNRSPESNLANLISAEKQQEKLRLVAADIMQMFVDPKVYEFGPSREFFREIVADLILESLIEKCSKPEYLNSWIVYLLEQGEPELINALDAGLEQANKGENSAPLSDNAREVERKIEAAKAGVDRGDGSHQRNNTETSFEDSERSPVPGARAEGSGIPSSCPSEGVITPTSSSSGNPVAPQNRRSDDVPPMLSAANDPLTSPAQENDGTRAGSPPASYPVESRPSDGAPATGSPATSLRKAEVSLIDEFNLGGVDPIFRTRPTTEYLIQIEPVSSRHQGWMVARQFADFEELHETLRRISVISGVNQFTLEHPTLPAWKGQSKDSLRDGLEGYLRDALRHDPLADSSALKNFFDKSRGSGNAMTPGSKATGFSFPNQAAFESMGKGMLGVLSNAPKGVAGGGKAVFDGVTGVFGATGVGNKKSVDRGSPRRQHSEVKAPSDDTLSLSKSRESSDITNKSVAAGSESTDPQSERAPTFSPNHRLSMTDTSRTTGVDFPQIIDDDRSDKPSQPTQPDTTTDQDPEHKQAEISTQDSQTQETQVTSAPTATEDTEKEEVVDNAKAPPPKKDSTFQHEPFSEDETMMAVELLFAVINEMYGVSSVWKIRKALLNATKSFLLRPGNPNLKYICELIQKSVAENTSDESLAGYVDTLRETCFPPTDGPPYEYHELSDHEKEELRVKARGLLVARGMPPALAGVMGTSATAEALGRVFDSLQIQPMTRGLVFVILLQALKIVIQ